MRPGPPSPDPRAGTNGTRLTVTAEGEDAEDALDAIASLVRSGFDDE